MENIIYPVYTDEFTVGDLLPAIGGQYPYDLTGHVITLHIRRPQPHAVITKTAVIDDAATGLFHFNWSAGDLVAGLNQLCEIQDVNASGQPITKKFFINVVGQIA